MDVRAALAAIHPVCEVAREKCSVQCHRDVAGRSCDTGFWKNLYVGGKAANSGKPKLPGEPGSSGIQLLAP